MIYIFSIARVCLGLVFVIMRARNLDMVSSPTCKLVRVVGRLYGNCFPLMPSLIIGHAHMCQLQLSTGSLYYTVYSCISHFQGPGLQITHTSLKVVLVHSCTHSCPYNHNKPERSRIKLGSGDFPVFICRKRNSEDVHPLHSWATI